MAVDLTIDPDTVRHYAQKARAINALEASDADEEDRLEAELDAAANPPAHHQEGLAEEESGDMTRQELTELINDLNTDEAIELVALVWIGRSDFEVAEWHTAKQEARQRAVGPTSSYLLGMPLLADYLEEGLNALDY
jgi:hypothetical protein